MKLYIVMTSIFFSLIMSISSVWADDGFGPCKPRNGTNVYEFSLIKTISAPEDNYEGKTFPDFTSWDSSGYYVGQCQCPTSVVDGDTIPSNYMKASSDLPSGHNDGNQYYKINYNLEFAAQVWIGGRVNSYFSVPFTDVSNDVPGSVRDVCLGFDDGSPALWGSGGKGKISLYIEHPFVGVSEIPRTKLLSVLATLQPGFYGTQAMSEVYISGAITVNQGCTIPAGYTVEIPFGEYNARDFKGKVGSKPDNVKVIEKTLDFKCANVSDGIKIYLKLEGNPNATNPDAIDLGNPDIGAVVTDDKDQVLKPNSADAAEMTVSPLIDDIHRNAQIKLKAYPIGITGKMPASGSFEGVATLDVNLE